MSTARVLVAVPTYLRPADLAELLPMLQQQIAEVTASGLDVLVRTVVIDNDPAGSARPVVDALRDVSYVHEAEPGISAVRNRALEIGAIDDVLVMLDDDERPHRRWLASLLKVWRDTGAALVAGRVVAEYEGELDPWIRAGDFFVRRTMPTGTPIQVAAAGNLLLDLAQVRSVGLRFESRFGLSGGEDNLFSRRLGAAGLSMVWCAESVVTDRVPATRMTRRWVLTRAWSHGNTTALIDVELARPGLPRVIQRGGLVGGGVVRIVLGLGRAGLGMLTRQRRHQARGLRTAMRGGGMIFGAVGHVYEAYRRPEPARTRIGVR